MILPRFIFQKNMPDGDGFPLKGFFLCIAAGLIGNIVNVTFYNHATILVGATLNGFSLGLIYPMSMAFIVCTTDKSITGSVSSLVASTADIGVICSNLFLGIVNYYLGIKMALLIPIVISLLSICIFVGYLAKYKTIRE